MIRRVLYVSRASYEISDSQLQMLATRASNRNATVGLTGLLVYGGGWFMQVIEGPTTSVELVLARIFRDDRHRDAELLLDDQSRDRMFMAWSMGVYNLDSATADIRDRLLGIVEGIRKPKSGTKHSRAATMLLLREFQVLVNQPAREAG